MEIIHKETALERETFDDLSPQRFSSVCVGESHWVDQLFVGAQSDWDASGGWTISWGEKRTGIYNNQVDYTEFTIKKQRTLHI